MAYDATKIPNLGHLQGLATLLMSYANALAGWQDATTDYSAWETSGTKSPDAWPAAAGTATETGYRIPEGKYRLVNSRTVYYFDITDSDDGVRRVITWSMADDGTPNPLRIHDYLGPDDVLADANASLVFDLERASLEIYGTEYLNTPPTRVVIEIQESGTGYALQSVKRNGAAVSFGAKSYSNVLAAINSAVDTGGSVVLLDRNGMKCRMAVQSSTTSANLVWHLIFSPDDPIDGYEFWKIYLTKTTCSITCEEV